MGYGLYVEKVYFDLTPSLLHALCIEFWFMLAWDENVISMEQSINEAEL